MDSNVYEVKCPKKINENAFVKTDVPGSKSITNRALLLAAMSNGTSTLKGCLTSEDAKHFLECLKTLGFPVEEVPDGKMGSDITITGFGGKIPNKMAEIYVGSAGTAARFLVAMLAFSDGEYVVNSSDQMKKRPMQPLIDSLKAAGATVECVEEQGRFPLHIIGAGDPSGIPDCFSVNIDKSSQFLSALLIAVGTLGKKAEINVVGSHGLSYVDLTAEMMKSFGISVEKQIVNGQIQYLFSGEGSYKALNYDVEPDMSAAAYFYALAAVLDVTVAVNGVKSSMLQGDVQFLKVLEKMGCSLQEEKDGTVAVTGPEGGALKGGFSIDMSAFSDQALTLAAIAPFADNSITITGIGHIRLQECDRIAAIVKNLTTLGIRVEEKEDEVTIYPGTPTGGNIETYDDHRVAMSFVLTGLRTEGVFIQNPSCCKKTFAEYFDVLEDIMGKISE
ncbi:MAG: 3-phosphoshikimate 1-carboxyvinyltransferase [Roseburia sp.]